MKALSIATALLTAASFNVSAQWFADPDVPGLAATSTTSNGIVVVVGFVTKGSVCDTAFIAVLGRRDITSMRLYVDDQYWDGTMQGFETDSPASGISLGHESLKAIKNGSRAAISTNQGDIAFTLDGSAKALNQAYGACMEQDKAAAFRPMVPEAAQPSGPQNPMVPEAPQPVNQAPATTEYRF